jgi:hypothetical protein
MISAVLPPASEKYIKYICDEIITLTSAKHTYYYYIYLEPKRWFVVLVSRGTLNIIELYHCFVIV